MVLQSMKMLRVLFIAFAVMSVVPSAWSDDLDNLRRSGAVGEKYDGLAVARDSSASGFVSSVNAEIGRAHV